MVISTSVNTYGVRTSQSIERPIVLKERRLSGLNYPIPKNPTEGYFSKSTNLQLIRSNLRSLIKTERGERFMRPDYGCNLRKFLMEPLDEATFNLIKEEITVSIRRYLSTVSLRKIQVIESDTGNLNVSLFCALRDSIATAFNIGVRI
jgi:phage baseplate assembly protein W